MVRKLIARIYLAFDRFLNNMFSFVLLFIIMGVNKFFTVITPFLRHAFKLLFA